MEYRVTVNTAPNDTSLISIEDLQDDPVAPMIKVKTGSNSIYYPEGNRDIKSIREEA